MDADKIRANYQERYGNPAAQEAQAQVHFLAEIAAQLAELNKHVSHLCEAFGNSADKPPTPKRKTHA